MLMGENEWKLCGTQQIREEGLRTHGQNNVAGSLSQAPNLVYLRAVMAAENVQPSPVSVSYRTIPPRFHRPSRNTGRI
jgi:hypothetical protein